ncbi:MAG: hypothetical protein KKB37_06150 [Alphaproteobacteria bacterium]|nr:hypothetical protein [Alphaproteobacteria bacterium]
MIKRLSMAIVASGCVLVGSSIGAAAQTPPVSDAQPDCQTVLQCNFTKGGVYRGCISAYSCRRCRLVRSNNCSIGGQTRRVCRRLVCSWG